MFGHVRLQHMYNVKLDWTLERESLYVTFQERVLIFRLNELKYYWGYLDDCPILKEEKYFTYFTKKLLNIKKGPKHCV